MRCGKCQKLYDDAVRGVLSERLDRKVREHASSCPTCAVFFQENDSLRKLVRESSEPARVPDAAAFVRMARVAVAQVEAERAQSAPARPGLLEAFAGLFRGGQSPLAGLVKATAFVAVGALAGVLATTHRPDAAGDGRIAETPAPVAPAPTATPLIRVATLGHDIGALPAEPNIPPLRITPGPGISPDQSGGPSPVLQKRTGPPLSVAEVETGADLPPRMSTVNPMLFAQAMDRAVALFEKMPASDEVEQLRKIRTVSSQVEVSALLTGLQDMKLQLVRDGRTEYIAPIHQIERVLKQMAAVSPRPEAADGFAYLDIYQEAETALIGKKYGKAIKLFRDVIVMGRGTYLAARAKYHLGNINFEIMRDYGNALADYNEFLRETPDKYLSKKMLEQVRERIDLITGNAENKYAPLRVFDAAQLAKTPDEAVRYYITLMQKYPDSALVRRAIESMARIVRQNPDNGALAEQVLEELDQFQSKHSEHPLTLHVDLAFADIGYYRTRNHEQAEHEYSEILKKIENPELEETVRQRLVQINRGN